MVADCHIHMVLDGKDWRAALQRHSAAPDILWIRKILEAYRCQGFTYLRDGGDRWGVGKTARMLSGEYGICYRTPLAPLCQKGYYGGFIGVCYKDLREYASLVRKNREEGADFIKIMISGLMDFHHWGVLTEPGLPGEQIRELIHIAHEEGMAVMAHANGARTIEAAAAAGVDSVEHGAYADASALDAMRENGTVWVPTVSTVANLLDTHRYQNHQIVKILEGLQENIRIFAAAGGLIAPGTDAGAWAVLHAGRTEETLLLGAGVTREQLKIGIGHIQNKF